MKIKKSKSKYFRQISFITIIAIFFCAISIIIPSVIADTEPNDSFQNAEEINAGSYDGSIDETDTEDYYKIQLEPSSIISITYSSDAVDGEQKLYFYNPTKEEILYLFSSQYMENSDLYYLANETDVDYWYIKVVALDSFEYGDYTLEISIDKQDDADTDKDVAGDYINAFEINAGIDITGLLRDLDTNDMFKILIEGGSTVTITYYSDAVDGEQKLYLYNPSKEEILGLFSSGFTEVSDSYKIQDDIDTDYYYIEVIAFDSFEYGDYSFKVTIESENISEDDIVEEETEEKDETKNGEDTSGNTPGFEIITLVSALLIAFLFVKRRKKY